MTISELHIQLDLQSENRIDILENIARKCNKGYLFVDSSDGYCYLFGKNGNEVDIKKLKKIDNDLFYYSNIVSIIIPDSVKNIGNRAFWDCENLKLIEIPDSVKSIGNDVFAYCRNLKSIIIPNSVKSIGNGAFWICESLKSLIFKGKTMKKIKTMYNYPFGIKDESIIRCI